MPVSELLQKWATRDRRGVADYFFMRLLAANPCKRAHKLGDFIIYKKDGRGGIKRLEWEY